MPTVELTKDWSKRHMARAVPGAFWSTEHKAWAIQDPTPRAAAVALKLFPDLANSNPELLAERGRLAQEARPFDNATPAGLRISESLDDFPVSLYEFQDLDVGYIDAVLERHGGAYIGWSRGLGKTLGSLALAAARDLQRVLIVCPNTSKQAVWAPEVQRVLPDHELVVLPNEKTKRERAMRYVAGAKDDPLVLIVHYEALSIVAGKRKRGRGMEIGDGWRKLGPWDLVVADEAHRIKEAKTQMARALKKVPARRRLALSGSIIENHAEELFSVLQWLFPDRYRAKWRDWNDRFLDYVDSDYGRVCVGVKPECIEEMRQELGVFMVYRTKEDELDLPEKTEQTLLVDLSPGQRAVYDQLREECLAELDDGTKLKAADGLVMLTRLRQVASGLDLFSEHVADSAKLDLAHDLILDAEDEAFVVFTWYKAAGHALRTRLEKAGVDCFLVDGDVPHDKRADCIARFQAGEGRAFIGTLATLSESVTLHRASNAVFLDRSFNPATNAQAEDRIYRIGQDKPVTITHIVARNTVDELRVQPVLAQKQALRAAILGGK